MTTTETVNTDLMHDDDTIIDDCSVCGTLPIPPGFTFVCAACAANQTKEDE